ncbi:hypothetical protein CSUI_004818 [Cystoisospora suis]|uniref:Uncharacterized protein n=1 Tax=Cystoisospora suis TaxID=483139 RepID=A0A2C6KLI1_9APIC|nr:hypothetical protein CSUI_004818 [Cystoisospora suis]
MDPFFMCKALGFATDPPLDRVQPKWWMDLDEEKKRREKEEEQEKHSNPVSPSSSLYPCVFSSNSLSLSSSFTCESIVCFLPTLLFSSSSSSSSLLSIFSLCSRPSIDRSPSPSSLSLPRHFHPSLFEDDIGPDGYPLLMHARLRRFWQLQQQRQLHEEEKAGGTSFSSSQSLLRPLLQSFKEGQTLIQKNLMKMVTPSSSSLSSLVPVSSPSSQHRSLRPRLLSIEGGEKKEKEASEPDPFSRQFPRSFYASPSRLLYSTSTRSTAVPTDVVTTSSMVAHASPIETGPNAFEMRGITTTTDSESFKDEEKERTTPIRNKPSREGEGHEVTTLSFSKNRSCDSRRSSEGADLPASSSSFFARLPSQQKDLFKKDEEEERTREKTSSPTMIAPSSSSSEEKQEGEKISSSRSRHAACTLPPSSLVGVDCFRMTSTSSSTPVPSDKMTKGEKVHLIRLTSKTSSASSIDTSTTRATSASSDLPSAIQKSQAKNSPSLSLSSLSQLLPSPSSTSSSHASSPMVIVERGGKRVISSRPRYTPPWRQNNSWTHKINSTSSSAESHFLSCHVETPSGLSSSFPVFHAKEAEDKEREKEEKEQRMSSCNACTRSGRCNESRGIEKIKTLSPRCFPLEWKSVRGDHDLKEKEEDKEEKEEETKREMHEEGDKGTEEGVREEASLSGVEQNRATNDHRIQRFLSLDLLRHDKKEKEMSQTDAVSAAVFTRKEILQLQEEEERKRQGRRRRGGGEDKEDRGPSRHQQIHAMNTYTRHARMEMSSFRPLLRLSERVVEEDKEYRHEEEEEGEEEGVRTPLTQSTSLSSSSSFAFTPAYSSGASTYRGGMRR